MNRMEFLKRLFLSLALLPVLAVNGQNSSEEWITRGMGYDSSNRFDSSLVCYKQALAADSLSVEAGWRLAAAWFRLDSLRQSIDQCMKVIEMDRKCKEVYYVLGSVFFEQGSHKSAEEYLRRATEFGGPGYVGAWCKLGESLLFLGDTVQAEACLRSVLENDESFQRAYFVMGEICRARGENAQAVEWYGKAVRRFPLYPEALFSMARCYAALANLRAAIECMDKVVRLTPDDKEACFFSGKCLYLNGETEKARRRLLRALSIDPSYNEAQALLSLIDG